MSVTIYKIGGSLLTYPDLVDRLRNVVSANNGQQPLCIVGGGDGADIVRNWDRIHQLGDEVAHWLAIQSLQLNNELLLQIWPDAVVVDDRETADAVWAGGEIPVLNAYEFLIREEAKHQHDPLPHDWSVTSDSIAAWLTKCWPAERLVLLKSEDLAEGTPITEAAERGLVDPYFPVASNQLSDVEWVNLRAEVISKTSLRAS